MERLGHFFFIFLLLCLGMAGVVRAAVEMGSPAPDFCLPASEGDSICLKDYRAKKNVVLLFYLLDFTRG
jgi:hypothetical protein